MDNDTTLHYAALVSQLTIHAKRVVRELDPSQELEQLRKDERYSSNQKSIFYCFV
jgi:hypothetical protein